METKKLDDGVWTISVVDAICHELQQHLKKLSTANSTGDAHDVVLDILCRHEQYQSALSTLRHCAEEYDSLCTEG